MFYDNSMNNFLINTGVLLIAGLHFWFLILEMFYWQKPLGRKIFRLSPEFAKQSAGLAANQGLYNGFLAAGLLWSLYLNNPVEAFQIKMFFLSCVFIAGTFGALTVSRKIFFIQGLPALIVLLLLFI